MEQTQIMGQIGISYLPAQQAAIQFAQSLEKLNAQFRQTQQIARQIGAVFAKDVARNVSQANAIYDQHGNILTEVSAKSKQTAVSMEQVGQAAKRQAMNVKQATRAEGELNSMLQRRFSWFATGGLLFGAQNVFRQMLENIGEVETGMVEISRISNDATADFAQMQDELFNLGVEFGRSWEEVQNIALRWSQAGYNVSDALEATKASLAALNTAELDAENATQSLIGIMAQWGLQSSDLLPLIDKLNITADNFSVTTQDLVDGLLRSSSAASVLGVTLEENIAMLTAMREASGRTGREVGNALNTILTYIQRPSTINVLESSGIQVFANEARTQFRSIFDIMDDLGTKWNQIGSTAQDELVQMADDAGLFNEEMASSLGLQEQWNDLQRRDISMSVAGTRRRNYLIAALTNWASVDEVLLNMEDSLGYSMEENQRTMETYQAKVQQLRTAFEELAVTIGEAGILDLMKGLADDSREAIETFQRLPEPIKAAIIAMTEYVAVLGIASLASRTFLGIGITEGMAAIAGSLGKVTQGVRLLSKALMAGNLARAGSILGMLGIGPAAGVIAGGAGILGIVAALSKYNEQQSKAAELEEKRQIRLRELINEHDRLNQQLENSKGNAEEYLKTNEKLEAIIQEIAEISPDLVSAWGEQGQAIAIAKGSLVEYTNQMKLTKEQMIELERTLAQFELLRTQQTARDARTQLVTVQHEIGKRQQEMMQEGILPPSGTTPYLNKQLEEARGQSDAAERAYQVAKARAEMVEKMGEIVSDSSVGTSTSTQSLQSGRQLTQYQRALAEFEYLTAMDRLSQEQQLAQLRQFRREYELTLEERRDLDIRIYRLETQLETERQKQIEDTLKAIQDETERYYDDAYTSALDYFQHETSLARMSRDQQIQYIRDLSQQYEWGTEKQWDIQERLFSLYSDELKDQQDQIEQAYRDRIDLIETETEKQIESVQAQLDALDELAEKDSREEAEKEHTKKLDDLRKQQRYHELRTGKEHEEALLEIEQQIKDEETRWLKQQTEWEREDRRQELQAQIREIEKNAEEEKKVWEQKYDDIRSNFDEWSEDFVKAAINDPKWFETGKSIGQQIAEGFRDGLPDELDSIIKEGELRAEEARSSIPESQPPPPVNRNYISDSAKSVLNELLYLKNQWALGAEQGNSGLKGWASNEAKKYYDMLPDDLSSQVKNMNNQQLKQFLDQAHTGAYVMQSGAAELLKGERVLSPQLTVQFDRLATALLNNQTPVNQRSVQLNGPLFNAEKVSFEDEQDMEIMSRELKRQIEML